MGIGEGIRRKIKRRQYEFSKHAEVTYTLQYGGRFYVIEHVPARVCKATGEQFFAP